ncbi:unnamed protein product [Miscanthus lutarioriparius]|uniref:F-box domain-containing protein n=1 Tax=Miscanthus lutarioriparius TaxID=422564 RepID=A0A811NXC9_9POAL|nr:unnamed protein product [Miscanthus lutarioriparius]
MAGSNDDSSFSVVRLRVFFGGPYLLRLAADAATVRLILRRQPHLLPFLEHQATAPDAEQWAPPLHAAAATGGLRGARPPHTSAATAKQKQLSHPTTTAGIRSVFFQDGFVSGCDASLLVARGPNAFARSDVELSLANSIRRNRQRLRVLHGSTEPSLSPTCSPPAGQSPRRAPCRTRTGPAQPPRADSGPNIPSPAAYPFVCRRQQRRHEQRRATFLELLRIRCHPPGLSPAMIARAIPMATEEKQETQEHLHPGRHTHAPLGELGITLVCCCHSPKQRSSSRSPTTRTSVARRWGSTAAPAEVTLRRVAGDAYASTDRVATAEGARFEVRSAAAGEEEVTTEGVFSAWPWRGGAILPVRTAGRKPCAERLPRDALARQRGPRAAHMHARASQRCPLGTGFPAASDTRSSSGEWELLILIRIISNMLEEVECTLNQLPEEVLANILRRLTPPFLATSRCVCKPWCTIIDTRRSGRIKLNPATEELEWPLSPCILHVFSSRTKKWEERSFVREGEAAGTVADMRLDGSYSNHYHNSVYWRGALYVHCQSNFVMRLSLLDGKYQMEWFLKTSICLRYRKTDRPKPWTLQDIKCIGSRDEYQDGNDKVIMEENFEFGCDYKNVVETKEWDSDDDNVIHTEGWGNRDIGGYIITLLGFYPYREVVFE